MKKIVALTGVFALAACGGNDASEPTEAVIDDTPETAVVSDAGTYSSLNEDGDVIAISLNADGTYTVSEANQQVENGTWEDTPEGACWTAEGEEEPVCATFAPGTEPGTVNVTSPGGETMTYSYES
ncbi:hypothetical protein [Erythrobacter alti]|uniref:hypothetical protein n=1 Tax=Erythrobacter alti TaxID=1896145 RepID=UPI0030F48F8A